MRKKTLDLIEDAVCAAGCVAVIIGCVWVALHVIGGTP